MFTIQNEIPLEWKENNVQSSNTGVTIQLLNSVNLKVFFTKQIQKEMAWQKWFWRMPVDHLRREAFVTFHVPLL